MQWVIWSLASPRRQTVQTMWCRSDWDNKQSDGPLRGRGIMHSERSQELATTEAGNIPLEKSWACRLFFFKLRLTCILEKKKKTINSKNLDLVVGIQWWAWRCALPAFLLTHVLEINSVQANYTHSTTAGASHSTYCGRHTEAITPPVQEPTPLIK